MSVYESLIEFVDKVIAQTDVFLVVRDEGAFGGTCSEDIEKVKVNKGDGKRYF